MLQFLLDEHISPTVCLVVRERRNQISIESVLDWQGGHLSGKDDHTLLSAISAARYTLVTYDLRTVSPLLRTWAATGLTHHGVIFIDERTCRPNDFSAIANALIRIWDGMSTFDWTNRVAFATRGF